MQCYYRKSLELTENMSSDAHNMVENASQFSEQNPDVLRSERDVDVEEFLHGQTGNNG